MPRTIEQGFYDFHDKIKTSVAETAAAKAHRASIESCLKSNFSINRFTRIGSFGNGTNISGYSDVDYLACVPTKNLTARSSVSLTNVKNALAQRFPSTGVKVDCPAVVCPFGSYRSEDTEIVVADYIREDSGFKVYEIADGNDNWMEISPDAHNYYVSEVDKKHNGKVKKLIRFIKAWKYFQNVPIKSFYLEMKVAKYAQQESCIVYDIDIKQIFSQLQKEGLSAMRDPMGVAGYIQPCKTEYQKQEALSKLNTAATRASNARDSTMGNNISDAFYWWNLLYNNKFPNYYL